MARKDPSLGLGSRDTPQVRGTTQSMVHGTLARVYTRVTCPQEGGVHAHRSTHMQIHGRAVNTCTHRRVMNMHIHREVCAHVFT